MGKDNLISVKKDVGCIRSEGENSGVGISKLSTQKTQEERRCRMLIEFAHDSFVAMDSTGAIIEWNHQAERTFGWSAKEAIGRRMAQLIMPQRFREDHERGLKRFLQTGEGPILGKRIELVALKKDGTEFPVEIAVTPMPWEGDYIFSAFIRDIGVAKEAETNLKISGLEKKAEDNTAKTPLSQRRPGAS